MLLYDMLISFTDMRFQTISAYIKSPALPGFEKTLSSKPKTPPENKILVAVLLEHALLQFLGCIEAHFFLSVVHGSYFNDNGQVSTRLDRNGHAGHGNIQNRGSLSIQSETVILLALFPRLQIDDQLDLSVILMAPTPKIRRTSTMPMPRSSMK